jgi:hypothetical protein
MAPTRDATAAGARLESGDATICPPGPGRDGCVDPTPRSADRRLPGPLQEENITDAAIMDNSGDTPPNIGHFP